jgi:hypothetical protein
MDRAGLNGASIVQANAQLAAALLLHEFWGKRSRLTPGQQPSTRKTRGGAKTPARDDCV